MWSPRGRRPALTPGNSSVHPLYPPTTPRQTAANCIVTLQICSGNQLGLTWAGGLTTGMIRILGGSPLVTWERDESRITMKAEDYAPIVASIQPFFFFPFLFAPAGPLRSSRQPAVKEVRLLETKARGRPRVTGGIASFTAGPHLPFQSGAKPLI